jgi:hypothetical protein
MPRRQRQCASSPRNANSSFRVRRSWRSPFFGYCYRAAPVFAAPPCPAELGADGVVAGGPAPVLCIGPRFNALNNAIIAMIVTAATRAPRAHPTKPGSVDVRGGSVREVHRAPGPFNRLGEFPAEQPNDLPLSPTAQAFYPSGPIFWQRYTSFWLTSLLNRIVFFVIPVVAALIPLIGFTPRLYRWLYVHRIDQLHRALGKLERELGQSADRCGVVECQKRLPEIESAVRSLKVARPFEVDLQRLRIHLRMVEEDIAGLTAA